MLFQVLYDFFFQGRNRGSFGELIHRELLERKVYMKKNLEYYTKLEEIMNRIDINGFQFHEIEEGKDYQWKPYCGPQPLDKIEEVISYRGQDILTYYYVKETHLRTSELVNPKVDWLALNEACHKDLLRMYSPLDLQRYLKHTKFSKSFHEGNQYLMGLLQFIFAIYQDMVSYYEQILERDIKEDAYLVKTCHIENGEMMPHSATVFLHSFEDWLKKYGMDEYRKMKNIGKDVDVIVLVNKDLCDGTYKLSIPYASTWKELC